MCGGHVPSLCRRSRGVRTCHSRQTTLSLSLSSPSKRPQPLSASFAAKFVPATAHRPPAGLLLHLPEVRCPNLRGRRSRSPRRRGRPRGGGEVFLFRHRSSSPVPDRCLRDDGELFLSWATWSTWPTRRRSGWIARAMGGPSPRFLAPCGVRVSTAEGLRELRRPRHGLRSVSSMSG